METYGTLWNPMDQLDPRMEIRYIGNICRLMDLANGCAGDGLLLAKVGFWCQSFLLNLEALEALESLEARNCDANFPKKKQFSSKCWKSSSTDLPKSSSLSVDQLRGQKNDVLTPRIPIRYW